MDKKRLLAIFGLIFLLAFSAGWLVNNFAPTEKQPDLIVDTADNTDNQTIEAESTVEESKPIWVYVVGEVSSPGVFQLPPGSRVFQAVELAGAGVHADPSQLDMARVLVDGEKIRVPKQGEKVAAEITAVNPGSSSSGASGLVNINTATLEALDSRLPGIGPSLAQRIIDYRSQHPFTRKEDLKEVSGIGDKRYESIQDLITVSP